MASRTSKITKSLVVIPVLIVCIAVLQLKGLTGPFARLLLMLPRPISAPLEAGAGALRRTTTNLISIRKLYVENAELKNRVQTLEQRVVALEGVQSENQTLRNTLGFALRPPTVVVPCTVIGRDPEGLTQTLVLSCGVDQGVLVGQGVVSSGYLIGKVVLVSGKSATVRLLTAPSTIVDARIAGKDLSGVLKGSFGSGLLLDYISETAEVSRGDVVATAGINDLVPPDILVGSIADIVKEPGALFYKLTVASPVDFRDLRYVHVLKP